MLFLELVKDLVHSLLVCRVGQAHQVQGLLVDFILSVKCVVELHNLKDGSHGLVVETLPIGYVFDFARDLVEAYQNLFDVFQVSVVLAAEALELFGEVVPGLPRLSDHLRQILSELELSLGEREDVRRELLVLLPQKLILVGVKSFAKHDELVSHILQQQLHLANLAVGQDVNPVNGMTQLLLHLIRIWNALQMLIYFLQEDLRISVQNRICRVRGFSQTKSSLRKLSSAS